MLIRPVHHELENWKWLAIITLSAVLTLLLATAVGEGGIGDFANFF